MWYATGSALLFSVNQTSHRYLLLACSGIQLQIYLGWKLLPEKHYSCQLSNFLPCWPVFLENTTPRVRSKRTKWWREMKILSLGPIFFPLVKWIPVPFGSSNILNYQESSLVQVPTHLVAALWKHFHVYIQPSKHSDILKCQCSLWIDCIINKPFSSPNFIFSYL